MAATRVPVTAQAKEPAAEPGRSVTPSPRPVFKPTLFLQRKCACGGGCSRCEQEEKVKKATIQPKLMMKSRPDAYEDEADRVAEQVVSMSTAPATISSLGATGPDGGGPTAIPTSVNEVLSSHGRPLEPATRAFFEPRFGHDFSHVRIHTGATAEASAREVNALAYTVGHHVVFGAAQYAPQTADGQRLVAHELAHVVQQGNSPASSPLALRRKVGRLRCPPNDFGAPADPKAALESLDAMALDLANQAADGLASDAKEVAGGIPDSPSVTFQSYQNHFGLPNAVSQGFLNRLTGIVRPSQEIAASEELRILSKRFRLVAQLFSQTVDYVCPGDAVVTTPGCGSTSCGPVKAKSCRDHFSIIICQGFWKDIETDEARASVLIHEAMHIILGTTPAHEQGEIGDETQRGAGRNFNIAGCYELIPEEIAGVESPPPFPCPAPP